MRVLLVLIGVVAASWLALVVLAWGFQRSLIYLPDRTAPPPPAGVEAVTLETADGVELGAWYVPARGEPTSAVLVANGNAGNRAARLPLAHGLAARGHAVLLFDYRGYGGNRGRPSEQGLVADAHAALAHLKARPELDRERIVYLGESLGSGVVAALAQEAPPAVLVLRSPFPDLAAVGRTHYPFLPVQLLLRDRFPVAEQVASVDVPVLVVLGTADRIIPPPLSHEVADAAGAQVVAIAGADHNDRALLDGEEFLDAVDSFVRRHSASARG